jgi:23S rRNA (guanosine2251-2'-O)-methyltransferase
MTDIKVIVHDIRSTYNVGALLRTCEGIGVSHVYFTGYTPYPIMPHDSRLPHIAQKLAKQINKTALGAETMVKCTHQEDVITCINNLKAAGYAVIALEQSVDSMPLPAYNPPENIAILLGREVEGVDPELLTLCDSCIEIPMLGKKESFNVVQAAAMTLYKLRFD